MGREEGGPGGSAESTKRGEGMGAEKQGPGGRRKTGQGWSGTEILGTKVRLFRGGGGTTRCRPPEAQQGVSKKMIAMAFLETIRDISRRKRSQIVGRGGAEGL